MFQVRPTICLACLLFPMLATQLHAGSETPFRFRGVQPGVTTEEQLLGDSRWGKPGKRTQTDDGSTWLEYQTRGYERIGALVRGGKVQTIDVTLPDGLEAAAVSAALGLGEADNEETLPPAAMIGPKVPEALDVVHFPLQRAAVFVSRQTGKAELLRAYAENILPLAASSVDPPRAPDDPSAAPATETRLKGQDAKSRQIVAAVAKVLPSEHLSRHPLDDEIAKRTLQLFIKNLDPSKIYFTQDDVAGFTGQYDRLDNQLAAGDLGMAYEIFKLYWQRSSERVALAEQLLAADFDFTADEYLVSDTDKVDFPENELEVREIWRKRIKYDLLVEKTAGASLDEARRRVRRKYYGFLVRMSRYEDEDVMELALNALANAYDPHSQYYSQRAYEDMMISNAGELFGIGASLRLEDGYVTVTEIIKNSPAARDARLAAGDRILAVGQDDGREMMEVTDVRLRDAVKLIRGKEGTKVRLRILPKGEFESSVYEITRGRVEVQSIEHSAATGEALIEDRPAKIGYIKVPTFYTDLQAHREGGQDYRGTTPDLRKALNEFNKRGVSVVVIDLMSNGGGSLIEATAMPGLFLDGEPLTLQVKGADGNVQAYTSQGVDKVWSGPLVVLTSRVSAGASEIFAAAVQDYRRGLVIGDSKTHGIGTVGNVIDVGQTLAGGGDSQRLGHMKLVIQKYYRPSGEGMQARGVVPDIVLPAISEHMDLGEELFSYALKFDRVAAGEYTKSENFPLDDKLRSSLARRSESRRTESKFFQDLSDRIADYKSIKGKPVPLNEEKFLARRRSTETAGNILRRSEVADRKESDYLKEAFMIALDYAARMHFAVAEKSYRNRQFAAGMRSYHGAVEADPAFTAARYKYAWALATCPDARFRDGKLAVEQAQEACELDGWTSWYYILTLAISEAEVGDFQGAQQHLKSALEKAPEKQRATYRFLEERFRNRQPYQLRE